MMKGPVAALVLLAAARLTSGAADGTRDDGFTGVRQTPIEHVVIIHKENRSFDHYFGAFPGADGAIQGEMHDGTVVDLVRALDPMHGDIQHSNSAWVTAYNEGAMNGFDLEQGAFQQGYPVAYSQMAEDQLPNYWAYARRYGLGDHMFQDFKGATFANNLFRFAAQAGREDPTIGNRSAFGLPNGLNRPVFDRWGCDEPFDHRVQMRSVSGEGSEAWPCFTFKALPNTLSDYAIPWHVYVEPDDPSGKFMTLDAIAQVRYQAGLWQNIVPLDQFETDALTGNLPAVSWVEPIESEHPLYGTACAGENETVRYVNAVMNGADWSSTVIIVTWDDWGGFYDHVPPPQVDDVSYGFRVPLLMISPWIKYGGGSDGGYINSTFFSHASPLKFIEVNWDLPSLNSRDAGSNDMMDFFDFDQVPKAALLLQERQCPTLTPAQLSALQATATDPE